MVNCIKTCDCENCEMLMTHEPITIIKNRGFNEVRHNVDGVKCMQYGHYAFNVFELKTSEILDNMIWIE